MFAFCLLVQRVLKAAINCVLRSEAGDAQIIRSTDDEVSKLLEGDQDFQEFRNAVDPGFAQPGGLPAVAQPQAWASKQHWLDSWGCATVQTYYGPKTLTKIISRGKM
jgi:hypothetical protein